MTSTLVSELVEKLLKAKEAYYNTSTPIMTDAEYDDLEEKLRVLDPNNSFFSVVGFSIKGTKKVTHRIPMLSADKVKTKDELNKWITKIKGSAFMYVAEPKIDGCSCGLSYYKGELIQVVTRGNGKVGQDITHIAEFINTIPKKINHYKDVDMMVYVRGELYLPKNTTVQVDKSLRNTVVGLINRKDNNADLKHVKFVAYQIYTPYFEDVDENPYDFDEEKHLIYLKQFGFHTVEHHMLDRGMLDSFYLKYLNHYRDEWEYETDGIMLIVNNKRMQDMLDTQWTLDHHHHYNIAYKPPSEAKSTFVKEIEWNVTRSSTVVPVLIVEPVNICGATISRISLNNFQNVKTLGIGKGDEVEIIRSNDVIPYLKKVIKSKGIPELISHCPSCHTELVEAGVHMSCTNPNCEEANIQKILFWVVQSEMEGVSESTVRTLYTKRFVNSIRDLYYLQNKEYTLQTVEGFGYKKISNLFFQIDKSKSMTTSQLIAKLGIPLVGEKAVRKLGIYTMKDFWKFNDSTYVIGTNIIDWKGEKKNRDLVNELLLVLDIKDDSKSSGAKVCATGSAPMPRKQLIEKLEEEGYQWSDSVTKDTELLLTDDLNGKSSKMKSAQKHGTKVMLYDEFLDSL